MSTLDINKSRILKSGHTLIELVVVISIITIFAAIVLFDPVTFDSRKRVQITANELAVRMREIQFKSTTGSEKSAGSGIFPSYGMSYGVSTEGGGVITSYPNSFIFFADLDGSGRYEDYDLDSDGNPDEKLDEFMLPGTVRVDAVHFIASANYACASYVGVASTTILYDRPEPASEITIGTFLPDTNWSELSSFVRTISFELTNDDATSIFNVWSSGQISITSDVPTGPGWLNECIY